MNQFPIPDTIIANGKIVNVFSGTIVDGDIAVKGGMITYVGTETDSMTGPRTRIIEANGKYVVPGLIETHVHTCESFMTISQFAKGVMPHGTTSVITDFYGECVVGGPKAVRFFLEEAKRTPLKVFWIIPSSAHYQNMPFGHTGRVRKEDLLSMVDWPECHGLNEAFVTEVLKRDPFMLKLIARVRSKDKVIYGHASETKGDSLQLWLNTVGRVADHETTTTEEAVEKNNLGIWLAAREGSTCNDQTAVLAAVSKFGADPHRFMFCTDIASPSQLKEGHIDNNIRLAIRDGIDPVVAVQMATINAAQYMRLDGRLGSLSPGKAADLLLVDDLTTFDVSMVMADGKIVAESGRYLPPIRKIKYPSYMYATVRLKKNVSANDVKIPAPRDIDHVMARVIGVTNGTIITEELHEEVGVKDGEAVPDLERDVLKIVAVERHLKSGKVGRGFVHGFNLKKGAIGTTESSQRHDMLIVGTSDDEIAFVANYIRSTGGGLVASADGEIIAALRLPILGLLSSDDFPNIVRDYEAVCKATRELGCRLDYPFHNLSFCGLPTTIGNLKITYNGLVRVWEEKLVDLFPGN